MPSETCTVCHRGLKTPESIQRGMGPVCASKNGLKDAKPDDELLEGQKLIDELFAGEWDSKVADIKKPEAYFIPAKVPDITLSRDGSGVHVNVPHKIVYHSPSGFEWGYGGSGPADLALNILASCVPLRQAWDLHQDFKWKFVSSVPREGGTIRGEDIRQWIEEQRRP